MAKYSAHDPYLDPDSRLLRNRLGITDQVELDRVEATFAAVRAYELEKASAPSRFDLDHLRHVHRTLFDDVYPWAGELRTVKL
jgi:fido (protein-threonine AMPylation protein)